MLLDERENFGADGKAGFVKNSRDAVADTADDGDGGFRVEKTEHIALGHK